jgi:hypothetical protein
MFSVSGAAGCGGQGVVVRGLWSWVGKPLARVNLRPTPHSGALSSTLQRISSDWCGRLVREPCHLRPPHERVVQPPHAAPRRRLPGVRRIGGDGRWRDLG